MSASADSSLAHALWRFREGWLPESRLTSTIDLRLRTLAVRAAELEACADLLRPMQDDPWCRQDEARTAALRALEWRDFERCIRLLHAAEGDLDDLEAAAAADRAFTAADDEWERFVHAQGLDAFADCPTLRIPSRLARTARELLRRGRPRQAKMVAAIRSVTCAALRDRISDRPEDPELTERLSTIARRQPGLAKRLENLRTSGLDTLVRRLADDLEARITTGQASAEPSSIDDHLSHRAIELRRRIATQFQTRED